MSGWTVDIACLYTSCTPVAELSNTVCWSNHSTHPTRRMPLTRKTETRVAAVRAALRKASCPCRGSSVMWGVRMKDVFFVAYVVKEGTVSELSSDEFASRRMRALARKFEGASPNNSDIRICLPTLTRMATPCACTVVNALAKIVLATIAVETVIVVDPVVSRGNAECLGGQSKAHQFPTGIRRESRPRAPDCRLVQKQGSARCINQSSLSEG
ncbi:MAG: hypothetical protein JWQ50_3568 [Caballeronia mineralivorans]|nr:hypothetical protein [Caballeronia mineralivorans]